MNASFRMLGTLGTTAALVAASFLLPISVRADVGANLNTFLTTGLASAQSDFTDMRGKQKSKGEFWMTGSFGTFTHCLVIDMPSFAAIMNNTDEISESDLQCTSPRVKMTQPQLLVWLGRVVGKQLGTDYKVARYPAKKHGDRSSIHWTSGLITVEAIVSGIKDLADHDASRNFFYIAIDHTHSAQDGSQ
jgi:hypothetical protein